MMLSGFKWLSGSELAWEGSTLRAKELCLNISFVVHSHMVLGTWLLSFREQLWRTSWFQDCLGYVDVSYLELSLR